MPDVIVYFGLVEFAALVLALAGVIAAGVWTWRARRACRERQNWLEGLPYPALWFQAGKVAQANAAAGAWRENLDVRALAADAQRSGQHIVRTVPAVEGQSFQARAVRVTSGTTLVLLEDLAAAGRQQAFYRHFIQNVSHELKTPLTVIQGHAAKLGDDRAGWQASVTIIAEEAKRLTQLVDNLLTLARLEAPAFALERVTTNLAGLLEEVILQVSDLAETRQLALNLNVAPGLPRLMVDRARLKQVLLNLLDNALKYTPAGGTITVTATATASQVRVAVADTGEGIPAEDLPYIFEKLYRVRRPKGRPVEGSGLGLTIAQQIVRAHGGELTVTSAVGSGTTFTFQLPVTA